MRQPLQIDSTRLKTIAIGAAIFSALLLAISCSVDHPRMVNVGNRSLFLNCSGRTDGPTVVLDSGSGENSATWSDVQWPVCQFAHVCSYDHAGEGRSPSAGHAQSIAEEVADLHALLVAARVPGPYVMVGHSSGGLRVRRYQEQFPKDVVGMVLVDSSHEEQVWRFMEAIPGSVYGFPLTPEGLRQVGMLPARQHLQWHTDIPLIVIAHGGHMRLPRPMNEHSEVAERLMRELQQDLASRDPRAQLWIAKNSGHDIQIDEPELVVRAIKNVLNQVRKSR